MCVLSIGGDANDDTLAAAALVRIERSGNPSARVTD
jgi:hypothetical protein